MKRRNFLKSIIGSLTWLFLPQTKKTLPDGFKRVSDYSGTPTPDMIAVNGVEPVQEWKQSNYMDFEPDSIIGLEKYQGRLIVYCEHSIWEIEENCYGDGFQRKQLSFFGTEDGE